MLYRTRRFLLALVLSMASALAIAGHTHAEWSPCGVPATSTSGYQASPAVYSDGRGGAFVGWTESRTGELTLDAYLQHLDRAGESSPGWNRDGLALPSPADDPWAGRDDLTFLADGHGGFFLAAAAYGTYGRIQVRHLTSEGATVPGWPMDGVIVTAFGPDGIGTEKTDDPEAVQGNGPADRRPSLALDGAGGVFVGWHYVMRFYDFARVQRVSASGQIHPGWPALGLDLGGSGFPAVICSDGAGGIYVAWTSWSERSQVLVQHILPDGSKDPGWPPAGRVASIITGDHQFPGIVPDAAGGCIVVWRVMHEGSMLPCVAQRIGADGNTAAGWPEEGVILTGVPDPQATFPIGRRDPLYVATPIVADGSGGAIVAWKDDRDEGITSNTFAQRVLADGTIAPGWPSRGITVCDAPGAQEQPRVASDGSGGVWLAWEDRRGPDADVYAHHLRGDGSFPTGWPSGGRRLCDARGHQVTPQISADAQGVAVAWVDQAGAAPRVVATRVDPEGVVATWIARIATEVDSRTARIRWEFSEPPDSPLAIYRRTPDGSWALVAESHPIGRELLYEDANVEAGRSYGYRVGDSSQGADHAEGEVWVDIPFFASLRLRAPVPNPVHGHDFLLEFTLESREPATLELLDLAGRRVAFQRIQEPRNGSGSARLELSHLAPGVYLASLSQGGKASRVRLVVTR